ncbi:hypothetical protein K1W54_07070 [Micromonospora sp. CPCC 205371]|nr:hypothetical protein [Micromonospora sp. CPCC 205371]
MDDDSSDDGPASAPIRGGLVDLAHAVVAPCMHASQEAIYVHTPTTWLRTHPSSDVLERLQQARTP